ncbi:hypothetical protein [Hymenobacter oligotrophus]|uniref:hypothetical protein n=1 Tax=Hymenobacter oligotrophus TaxID=2319843 RepID=UPI0013C3078D|nr:hypothetical protein [Hymenobacter oligotrophus]
MNPPPSFSLLDAAPHARRLVIICLPLLVHLSGCTQADSYSSVANVELPERPKTAAELRAELLAQEQSTPSDYLEASGTYRRNLINELVLEGDISNRATLAQFKDPVVTVEWYSKTNTLLANKSYSVYELLPAQGTVHFKLKTQAPAEVASVGMSISDATAVE